MQNNNNYLSVNKELWNKRTLAHLQSAFYDVPSFLDGKSSLNSIELALLGNVKDKKILHLQCHFGQDSLSLARMGADVTGIDLSDNAIEAAKNMATQMNINARFICCDLYQLPQHLDEQFDIVFTSYGTIGWLPDIALWATIVARFLKPKGTFVFVEFHPIIWMYDNEMANITYSYFNKDAIIETETNTYADKNAEINLACVTWNHGIGEVVNSLINKGLQIDDLSEYDFSPYNCFPNCIEAEPNKFRFINYGNKLPMVYSIKATKTI